MITWIQDHIEINRHETGKSLLGGHRNIVVHTTFLPPCQLHVAQLLIIPDDTFVGSAISRRADINNYPLDGEWRCKTLLMKRFTAWVTRPIREHAIQQFIEGPDGTRRTAGALPKTQAVFKARVKILGRLKEPKCSVYGVYVLRPGGTWDCPDCPETVRFDKHDVNMIVGRYTLEYILDLDMNLLVDQEERKSGVVNGQLPNAVSAPKQARTSFLADCRA